MTGGPTIPAPSAGAPAPVLETERVTKTPGRKPGRPGSPPARNGGGGGASAAAEAAADDVPRVKVAGFFWRLGAAVLDFLVLCLPIAGLWWALADHLPEGRALGIDFVVDMILLGDDAVHLGIAVMPLIAAAYFVLGTLLLGGSPGKWVAQLRVIDRRGGKATVLQGAIRALAYIPGLVLFGVGFFWIAVDRRKRGLHDLLAGTLVVRR